jgi:hypothetical protein
LIMLRVFASVLCGSSVAFFAGNSTAQNVLAPAPKTEASVSAPLTAQERLDAIRQALVEASLQTPTKVFNTSWLDTQNSLRESSSFKNSMQVEGLRIMAYGRDDSGQPKAKLQLEEAVKPAGASTQMPPSTQTPTPTTSMPKSFQEFFDVFKKLGTKQLSSDPPKFDPHQVEKICDTKLKAGLKHVMGVDLWMDASNPPALRASVIELMEEHLVNDSPHGAVNVWRMSKNNSEPSMANSMTAYERALTSNKPDLMPWQARLAVKSDLLPKTERPNNLFGAKGPRVMTTLILQVTPRDGQKGILQEARTLQLELDAETWKQPKLKPESYAALSQQFQVWKSALSQLVACEPLTPLVTAVRSETIVINAGSESGIRKGDEWLIADPLKFPSQLMGKDGASKTLLAQVENVSAFQSELTILAGPSQSVQKNWRAWPAETLVKEPANPPSGNGFFNKR